MSKYIYLSMKNSLGLVYYIIRLYKFALTFRAQSKINRWRLIPKSDQKQTWRFI